MFQGRALVWFLCGAFAATTAFGQHASAPEQIRPTGVSTPIPRDDDADSPTHGSFCPIYVISDKA